VHFTKPLNVRVPHISLLDSARPTGINPFIFGLSVLPKEDPKSSSAGNSMIEIPDIVALINRASPNITVRIDLSSCFIGSHFEQIEKCDPKSKYYQNLKTALKPDQLLNLHGDDRNGLIGESFGSRLYGIVKSINYSTSEAIFDSSEALFSVRKNKDDQLESYSCPIFTKDNNSSISSENHLRYLELASERADEFDSKAGTQNIKIGHQKYAQISQNSSLSKVDFEDRLFRAFQKELDNSPKSGVEFIQRLCSDKIDLNFKSKSSGLTILMFAIDGDHVDTVNYLAEEKTILNLKDNHGFTALMIAVSKKDPKTIEILIAKGANLNLQDINGSTALTKAINHGNKEVIVMLIEGGAKNYSDPQNLASQIDQKDVIETLNQAIKKEELKTPNSTFTRLNSREDDNQVQPSLEKEESEVPTPAPRSARLNSNLGVEEGADLKFTQEKLCNQYTHPHHYPWPHLKFIQNPQLGGGNPQSAILIGSSLVGSIVGKFIVKKFTTPEENNKKSSKPTSTLFKPLLALIWRYMFEARVSII